jgi:O-antigen/teichoic acid export membrane protein
MVRRFFRDSAVYVLPAALSSGVSFLLFPLYAHRFTPQQYGDLDLLLLTGTLIGFTVALEMYQAVGRYVTGETDEPLRKGYASTGLFVTIVMYLLFACVAESLAVPITHVLLGPHAPPSLWRIATAWMCVQGLLNYTQAQLRWQLRPHAFAVASAVNAFGTVGAAAVFVFGLHLEVRGALLGQLTGSSLALLYVAGATRKTFAFQFSLDKCRLLLRYSIPLVPSGVGVFLNLYADRLVIKHLRSVADVGLYGVGYRVATIVLLLLVGFQGAATPLILAGKDDRTTPRDIARIMRIFWALALSSFVALSLLATPMIRILAASSYQSASSVVPFLVIASLFSGMYFFAPGLVIAKKTVTMAKLTAFSGIANLLLAIVLVPPLGIVGAGISTAVTSLLWFGLLIRQSQRYYRVPHRWPPLVTALTVIVAFVGIALALLPSTRVSALDPGILAIRVLLVGLGVVVSIGLSLDKRDLGEAPGRLAVLVKGAARRHETVKQDR